MGETLYTIGTDQQQAWMKKNCFPPRGYGYSEPGTYSLDATEVASIQCREVILSSLSGSSGISIILKKKPESNPMISRID
nr:hypothetical protein [Mediterraneibacter faecis]